MEQLPSLIELIPAVSGTMIEYNGQVWLRLKPKDIPDHDVVRHGYRLYDVGDYDQEMDAFKVRPFKATLSDAKLQELATPRGD